MTWRDNLRTVTLSDGRVVVGGSFRGVPFFVETVERSGGRRAVVHEFPLRNAPYVEDLGRKACGYRLDAYVLGDDYLSDRDTLLVALEREGVGELRLPYYDVKRAVCTNLSVRDSKNDGGMAVFSLEFAEAPNQTPAPSVVVDAPAKVSTSANAARAAAKAELVERFDPAGLPAFAFDSAEAALTRAATAVADKLAPLVSLSQELAVFTGRIAILTAEAASLVRQPADAFDGFCEAITGIVGAAAAAPGAVADAFYEAYLADFGEVVTGTTATRQRELANQTALIAALRRALAIEAARLVALATYKSIDEATAARDQVATMLDEQAASAGDTAYPAIVDLRSQVLRAVPGGQAFASVLSVTRRVPVPSIVLAYQLYGSTALEQDIVDRNGVRHPGFVAGELKVLSNG